MDRPFEIPAIAHRADQYKYITSHFLALQRFKHHRCDNVPPTGVNKHTGLGPLVTRATIGTGPPRGSGTATPSTISTGEKILAAHLDITPSLQKATHSVVKARNGNVLSRGSILKTDHYPSGRALDLDLNVHGAPNFRSPRQGNLNVFGAAQPRTQGLRAILSILRASPNTPNPTKCIWFCTREEPVVYISGRPFVLRDATEPRRVLKLSDRAENLEAIEQRLAADIFTESAKYGGLILTHNEVAVDNGDGTIIPTWTAVDSSNVKTPRELFDAMRNGGWNVEVFVAAHSTTYLLIPVSITGKSRRIPISPDRPIEDNYLDAYLRVIKDTDPLRTALIFNCGMGVVRTTFAMVATSLVRRRQLIIRGMQDPYAQKPPSLSRHASTPSGTVSPAPSSESKIIMALEQASAQQDLNRSLLRIACVMQLILENPKKNSVIEMLLTQPGLLDNLRKSFLGNYSPILSLLGCLDDGFEAKKLADRVIDACDHVVNLREDIFKNRVRYSVASTVNEASRDEFLDHAVKGLERYFFIIAFSSYVESQTDFSQTFFEWVQSRTEIWNQIRFLRTTHGSRLNVFAPISDLSSLSRSGVQNGGFNRCKNNVTLAGGQILGDEYSDHVVRNRSGIILREGTLLKSDQWRAESGHFDHEIRGALNFRNIPGTKIYALGQPTLEAMDQVLEEIRTAHPTAARIVWIGLREEPVVYVNSEPYCLRREKSSLRNMKGKVAWLGVLEERLKDDVIAELNAFGGRLLLHTETQDGSVVPIWEDARPENISIMKETMASKKDLTEGVELVYARIPITAEKVPDFGDLSELMDVVIRTHASETPIVLNCQLGRGRSTLTSIILVLIQNWLNSNRTTSVSQGSAVIRSLPAFASMEGSYTSDNEPSPRPSYQVINNVLRVVRKGPAIKQEVDDAIDLCAEAVNLRDAIEESRAQCEQATDERQKKIFATKALQNLRRYFELIVFQAYLRSIEPDTMQTYESFESFVKKRPVLKTFEKELGGDSLNALKLLERARVTEGEAMPDEVTRVVTNRNGAILSASTILKSDFFSNLQKMSLLERIEGSPNFRRIPLALHIVRRRAGSAVDTDTIDFILDKAGARAVCGSGMPTTQGLRRALQRMDAHPEGNNTVFWTSLREEPVLYIAGRPHVLRLVDKPLENVEATGVTTAVVEAMEQSFKKDVLKEVRAGDGRILLHDEVEDRPGVFTIVPIWEHVEESDIMTPREVFDSVVKEGFKVSYDRVAITDEQAPLPGVFTQILHRVRGGLGANADFVFNCQMGRGRTTTGMVTACLIATTDAWSASGWEGQTDPPVEDTQDEFYDSLDGPSEEEAYMQGEYRLILLLVGVLSRGKVAKKLTDRAIDLMEDVQNLRKAIYPYKLKAATSEKGSAKQQKLMSIGVNYLYRYGMLIAFANYLIEMRESTDSEDVTFEEWMKKHREITNLLQRRSLD
ncbi:inositol hexakisphosphate-domain-containing protein [Thelephora terrestris]|uniref:Inositol hexakisphosphate-domain-containing protein n=1 Tax=Thelephora terrestris TaxID=56493 RepID=A0A9P6HHS7_9AGAM|nr:inositol hexakisphosphate-domain-containing protein [Thelephora terrestris]